MSLVGALASVGGFIVFMGVIAWMVYKHGVSDAANKIEGKSLKLKTDRLKRYVKKIHSIDSKYDDIRDRLQSEDSMSDYKCADSKKTKPRRTKNI